MSEKQEFVKVKMETAIGIDLGTTYSCVAVFRNDRVEIIQNEQGNRITPSCVAFTDVERLIGEAAVNQIAKNPKNSVFDAKRLIGRNFSDDSVQSDMKLWPFEVIAGDNNQPKIKVSFKKKEKLFSPVEISSMVLSKMKDIAEMYLGQRVTNAVITVPARFNDSQRKATKDAGLVAGLNVLRIINEPTAAAFAYGFDENVGTKNVLIFDAGGGTCDVSILRINGSNFEVKATAGDTHLGGEDLDKRLMNHFVDEIESKHKINIRNNKRALWRLKSHCESAKRVLSTASHADIEIVCLDKEFDFSATLTRAKFEDLTHDLLKKFVEPVGSCLEDAGMNTSEIDDVVLVGGSTRIPKLRELLAELFKGKKFCMSKNNVHPDEAVAYGAAVQAAILSGVRHKKIRDITLQDVTPLSLGLYVNENVMSVIIPRNTPVPAEKEELYFTRYDNQTEIRLRVYEGERTRATDNNLLADFMVRGIPPAPRGDGKLVVCCEVDADGILNVTATEVTTGNNTSMTIANDHNRMSKQEIDRMLQDAKRYKEEDEEYKEAMMAKSSLDWCVYKAKKSIQNYASTSYSDAATLRRMEEAIAQASQCLQSDQLPEKEYVKMEQMIKKLSF